jgi:hypothetical protein
VLWRTRQIRRLLNLIDHLPQNTRFYEQVSNDEEYAEMLLEAQEKAASEGGEKFAPGSPIHTWSPEVAILAVVVDKLSVLVEAQKQKPGQVMPYPRPKTAMDRVKHRRREQQHRSLVAQMVPGQE